jgi:FkbM family methyltransferase
MSKLLAGSPLAHVPVRIRRGPAKGARWTMFPFSAYWRQGGSEEDVASALQYLPSIKGIAFWDLGAHYGIHTVGMAMQIGAGGQVVAFEPDRGAFSKLSRHVTMNGLRNVKLFCAAASSVSGTEKLYLPHGTGSSVAHFRYTPDQDLDGVPHETVETINLDRLVESGEIREPDLIKIDVQGHAARAVAGAIKSIERRRPVIAFSSHGPTEINGTRALLEPLGYRVVALSGQEISWADMGDAILLPATH